MSQIISIDPITRIEGHSKISIILADDGSVADARFHVTQYRGFEKIIEGRPYTEMPGIMGRICGICTISHMLAAAKACDAIMAVRVPETANKLRRIVNDASLIQSHALSFFYLAAPDFLLGMESEAGQRNIFGMLGNHPEIAKDGVKLRSFGQRVIERMAGKRVHPDWIVPGGVSRPLEANIRDEILAELPEMYSLVRRSLDWFKRTQESFRDEIRSFANFPSLFMGLVNDEGNLDLYDGRIRVVDAAGRVLKTGFNPSRYREYIGEAVEPWTFLKFPYYVPMGYPEGIYRVGSLARLNVIDGCGTPQADQEWTEFRAMERNVLLSGFYSHHARLIECLFALEEMEMLLESPDILDTRIRAHADANASEGIGVTEAPRGTLIHHYHANEKGVITGANLVVATTHNNLAINRGVLQAARRYVESDKLTEGMLNRVEAVVRTFDPCLSCSTHNQGTAALSVELLGPDGGLLDYAQR